MGPRAGQMRVGRTKHIDEQIRAPAREVRTIPMKTKLQTLNPRCDVRRVRDNWSRFEDVPPFDEVLRGLLRAVSDGAARIGQTPRLPAVCTTVEAMVAGRWFRMVGYRTDRSRWDAVLELHPM